jgi:hypothetical protein
MPTRERVQQLIQCVESGRTEDALRDFYTDDIKMSENRSPPMQGKAANLKREQEFFAQVKQVNEYRAVSFLAGSDRSAIHWILDITNQDGQRLRLDEIAWQVWRGDKICEERFVYDPSTVPVANGASGSSQ